MKHEYGENASGDRATCSCGWTSQRIASRANKKAAHRWHKQEVER